MPTLPRYRCCWGLWLLPGQPGGAAGHRVRGDPDRLRAGIVAAARSADPRTRARPAQRREAGYNDGIVSLIFLFAVTLAADHTHAETPPDALGSAPPELPRAPAGVVVGAGLAMLTNAAERHELMTSQAKRLILADGTAAGVRIEPRHRGNGFVSAFRVAASRSTTFARLPDFAPNLSSDDVGFLLAAVMWFVFGLTAVVALRLRGTARAGAVLLARADRCAEWSRYCWPCSAPA